MNIIFAYITEEYIILVENQQELWIPFYQGINLTYLRNLIKSLNSAKVKDHNLVLLS